MLRYPCVMPWGGARDQNMLGSWNLVCYLCPDLNLQLCARVTPGSCPGVGLGLEIYKGPSDLTLHFILVFLLEVITWIPFMLGSLNLICFLPRPKHSALCLSCLLDHTLGGVRGPRGRLIWTHMSSMLMFFKSSYPNNHLSGSSHIWVIGTLEGWLSFLSGAKGQNLRYLKVCFFPNLSFMKRI